MYFCWKSRRSSGGADSGCWARLPAQPSIFFVWYTHRHKRVCSSMRHTGLRGRVSEDGTVKITRSRGQTEVIYLRPTLRHRCKATTSSFCHSVYWCLTDQPPVSPTKASHPQKQHQHELTQQPSIEDPQNDSQGSEAVCRECHCSSCTKA